MEDYSKASLSYLFNGNFLEFSIECEIRELCGRNEEEFGISYSEPYSIKKREISREFQKHELKLVFIWELFTIVVDNSDAIYIMY